VDKPGQQWMGRFSRNLILTHEAYLGLPFSGSPFLFFVVWIISPREEIQYADQDTRSAPGRAGPKGRKYLRNG
jgi:hypothetical protein